MFYFQLADEIMNGVKNELNKLFRNIPIDVEVYKETKKVAKDTRRCIWDNVRWKKLRIHMRLSSSKIVIRLYCRFQNRLQNNNQLHIGSISTCLTKWENIWYGQKSSQWTDKMFKCRQLHWFSRQADHIYGFGSADHIYGFGAEGEPSPMHFAADDAYKHITEA